MWWLGIFCWFLYTCCFLCSHTIWPARYELSTILALLVPFPWLTGSFFQLCRSALLYICRSIRAEFPYVAEWNIDSRLDSHFVPIPIHLNVLSQAYYDSSFAHWGKEATATSLVARLHKLGPSGHWTLASRTQFVLFATPEASGSWRYWSICATCQCTIQPFVPWQTLRCRWHSSWGWTSSLPGALTR